MDAICEPLKTPRRVADWRRTLLACFCALAAFWNGSQAAAQAAKRTAPKSSAAVKKPVDAAPKSDAADLTVDAILARIKALESAGESDLADKARVVELHQQALADLKLADEHQARATEFAKQRIATPYQLESRKREAQTPAQANWRLPERASLTELEQALATTEAESSTARANFELLEAQPQRRAARRLEIPQAIAAARLALDELDKAAAADMAGERTPLAQARTLARHAKRQEVTAEVDALEKELQTYDAAAAELLRLERDAAAGMLAEAEDRVTKLGNALNDRRRDEAAREAHQAHWAAASAEPAVRRLADENSALADYRQLVAEKIEQLAAESAAVENNLEKVSDQRSKMTEKVKAAGLTEAIGQMLRKHRAELMALGVQHKAHRKRHEEIGQVQLQLFDYEEELASLRDLDSRARELSASLPVGCQTNAQDLRSLLQTRREYVAALVKDYNAYFADLVELDSRQQELLQEADEYRGFIDERVLWIRSTQRLSVADVNRSLDAAHWLVSPKNWWQVATALAASARANAEINLLAAVVFAAWFWARRRLVAAVGRWGRLAQGAGGEQPMMRMLNTTLATVLVAAAWPALIWYVGWSVAGGSTAAGEFAAALGHGLQITATVLAPLLVTRQICRREGLAEAHFGWPPDALASIRRELGWLALVGAPLVAAIATLAAQSSDPWKDSLGRALFVVSQALLAVVMIRLLRPPRGGFNRLLTLRHDSWLGRTAYPIYLGLSALPVTLAVLATTGYYYTALRLAWRLQSTVWLVLALVVAQALLTRWLTGLYRRLAVDAVRRTGHAQEKTMAAAPAGTLVAVDAPSPIDVAKVDAQTQRLLHSTAVLALVIGLGIVWVDVLPAIRIFQQVTLWRNLDGNAVLSLANLLEAGIVLAMTGVAANNLPGLVEIALLQRLPMDLGLRYALASVLRYLIAIVGITLAGGAVGIGWPKIQWFAAAVTFGLGFGLQEIFANFVAGLIVLIERPIRVGDTVTVGQTSGVVSRIRMRATTIVDGDRKELIVPNKEFITARLVNWTLSDQLVRVVVKIGIAYGSDTALAQRLLLQVATQTPQVLADPLPQALFMGFADSSLEFELQVFVASVSHMQPVRHQLNTAIDWAFRASGIEIAFPHRDIHIRSVEGATTLPQSSPPAEQPNRESQHKAA